jgi:hypothetical protein
VFIYGPDGDLQPTTDQETKARQHVVTMLRASSYALRPSAAGGLSEILGETNPNEGQAEARRRVRDALGEAGLGNAPIDVAVEALGDEWRAKIQVADGSGIRSTQ